MLSLGPYLACSPVEDLRPSLVRHVLIFKTKVKKAKKAFSRFYHAIHQLEQPEARRTASMMISNIY